MLQALAAYKSRKDDDTAEQAGVCSFSTAMLRAMLFVNKLVKVLGAVEMC